MTYRRISKIFRPNFDPQLSACYDAQYPRPIRPVQSHPSNYPPPPSPSIASSHAAAAVATAGMLAPKSNFYHNIHPCEPLSQYPSRMQLTSSSVNPISQQASFYRNYHLDIAPTAMVPWATLPRRHNSHDVDTFPATTTTDSPNFIVTNSSNRSEDQSQISLTKSAVSQLTSVQQQSPNFQRRQRQQNVIQPGSPHHVRNPQKLPVKVSPPRSPINFPGCQIGHGDTTSPVISTSNSNNNSSSTTTNVIADISNNRRVNHITSGTANTSTTVAVPMQAGLNDAKQVFFLFLL